MRCRGHICPPQRGVRAPGAHHREPRRRYAPGRCGPAVAAVQCAHADPPGVAGPSGRGRGRRRHPHIRHRRTRAPGTWVRTGLAGASAQDGQRREAEQAEPSPSPRAHGARALQETTSTTVLVFATGAIAHAHVDDATSTVWLVGDETTAVATVRLDQTPLTAVPATRVAYEAMRAARPDECISATDELGELALLKVGREGAG